MSDTVMLSKSSPASRGWVVTFSGTGINLALGILYTWSMFKGAIEKEFGWQGSQLNDPYALCCLVFAFAMILAGRCQDRFGPRLTRPSAACWSAPDLCSAPPRTVTAHGCLDLAY